MSRGAITPGQGGRAIALALLIPLFQKVTNSVGVLALGDMWFTPTPLFEDLGALFLVASLTAIALLKNQNKRQIYVLLAVVINFAIDYAGTLLLGNLFAILWFGEPFPRFGFSAFALLNLAIMAAAVIPAAWIADLIREKNDASLRDCGLYLKG